MEMGVSESKVIVVKGFVKALLRGENLGVACSLRGDDGACFVFWLSVNYCCGSCLESSFGDSDL